MQVAVPAPSPAEVTKTLEGILPDAHKDCQCRSDRSYSATDRRGTGEPGRASNLHMEATNAKRSEPKGSTPTTRAVRAALDLVRWELDLRLASDADVTGAQRVRLKRAVIVGTRR